MSAPTKATFTPKGQSPIEVHFNPASLQLTLSTKLNEKKSKKQGGRQVVNEGTAKLAVELVFDTTDTLDNVCDTTVKVARLLGEKGKPPPFVAFEWGAFKFEGIVDSYKETLDFFSSDGVPLRSSVSLGMTQDEDIFARGAPGQQAAGWSPAEAGADSQSQVARPPGGGSTTTTATQAGAPSAGRAIAAMNGELSMRFPSAPVLTVDVSATLSPPAAFASVGIGGSPGGLPSLRGAFSGLRMPSVSASTVRLDASRLVQRVETHTHATEDGATFELGGRMLSRGSRLGGNTRVRMRFEEE
ncbi:hypothetical protein HUA74_42070 [Myxococcus sp. CA051A]|uniref:CIS tube protein n=1 Tax=unclassified Myxococcus TaxID=2648731 RepID=UPI00157A38ED|nr:MULTISPECIES: hypothetical protein [unclassified Myxococcus]NTX06652.1 hypothetical protein [Myxococcus sp. CA040A]NTX67257.1 hypothetical protein [Myxococcus sp. CA051A]